MKSQFAWLLGSTLFLGLSFTPAEAQLLDRLFGLPAPPPMEGPPPELLPEDPYDYEEAFPPEPYPGDPPPLAKDPGESLVVPERKQASPRKSDPGAAPRKANREATQTPRKKSTGKTPTGREARREERSTRVSTKEDAERALRQVERVRTHFTENKPRVGGVEKAKIAVIAGQPMPDDLRLYPLPEEVAFEVTSACPANYFVWGNDVVLVDTCSRQAVAVLAVSEPTQTASKERSRSREGADIGLFYDELGSHGTWVRHRNHNYVFVPAVERGWRPYVHGRWVWTNDHGWYWHSDEPFAWATYHYGRWGYEADYGWYWVPGNVWAPAWVTWRRGGGYVGWAPLAPAGSGFAIGFVEHYEPAVLEAWVFVPDQDFVAADVDRYVISVSETSTVLQEADDAFHVALRKGSVVNEFLPRDEVAGIVEGNIETYTLTEAGAPSEVRLSDGKIASFKTEMAEAEPDAAPAKLVSDPEEIEGKPILQDVARGDAPADAPPSAAEIGASGGAAERLDDAPRTPSQDERGAARDETRPSQASPGSELETEREGAAREGAAPSDSARDAPSGEEDRPTAAAPDRERPRADERRGERPKAETEPGPRESGRSADHAGRGEAESDQPAAESSGPASNKSDRAAAEGGDESGARSEDRRPRSAGRESGRPRTDAESRPRGEAPAAEPDAENRSEAPDRESPDDPERQSEQGRQGS